MPAERLECDGEPTFGAERRQVGAGLLVRRPQRPPESGLGFSGGQVARSGDRAVGRLGALVLQAKNPGASPTAVSSTRVHGPVALQSAARAMLTR